MDVEGQVGATQYCDNNGANCFSQEGGSFTVGGVDTSWYPVLFTGVTEDDLYIYRNSVHQDESWRGALNFWAKNIKTSAYGNFDGNRYEYNFVSQEGTGGNNQPMLAGMGESSHYDGHFVVWLMGGSTYYWRSSQGVVLSNSNSAGGSVTDGDAVLGVITSVTATPSLTNALYTHASPNSVGAIGMDVQANTFIPSGTSSDLKLDATSGSGNVVIVIG